VIDIQQYSTTGRLGILRQGKANLINEVTIVGKDTLGNATEVTGNITLALREGATNIYTCPYSDLIYTFTRTDNGSTDVTLESGAKIVTYCSYAYDGNWCVIFMGQNGGYSDFDELIKQQREILEACDCPTNFVIIGLSSGTASDRASMEAALREYWGEHYFSAREFLSSEQALALAGFGAEEIASVTTEIQSGKVSSLLLHDNTHLNAVGYALLANAVFERMADLGYFDPIFEYYESLE
jgi:lysophospholipase L1-like esterase